MGKPQNTQKPSRKVAKNAGAPRVPVVSEISLEWRRGILSPLDLHRVGHTALVENPVRDGQFAFADRSHRTSFLALCFNKPVYITGLRGIGKTTIANFFSSQGLAAIDADLIEIEVAARRAFLNAMAPTLLRKSQYYDLLKREDFNALMDLRHDALVYLWLSPRMVNRYRVPRDIQTALREFNFVYDKSSGSLELTNSPTDEQAIILPLLKGFTEAGAAMTPSRRDLYHALRGIGLELALTHEDEISVARYCDQFDVVCCDPWLLDRDLRPQFLSDGMDNRTFIPIVKWGTFNDRNRRSGRHRMQDKFVYQTTVLQLRDLGHLVAYHRSGFSALRDLYSSVLGVVAKTPTMFTDNATDAFVRNCMACKASRISLIFGDNVILLDH